MIKSILDNDLYKLTMQQAVHALYPRAEVQYVFINRGKTPFPVGLDDALRKVIDDMAALKLLPEEETWLKEQCYFLTPVYIDFLKNYRYSPEEVVIDQNKGHLDLSIKGPWYRTILWEVPLLALISELYFTMTAPQIDSREQLSAKNQKKAQILKENNVRFADFGTRRRFSMDNQDNVLADLLSVDGNTLLGTSNVYFARKHGIKSIGTHAHEWFMYHAAENGYRLANKASIKSWLQVFQGHLGIALTDTYTTDVFLDSFDSVGARLFDGVRQDSGDPFEFLDKMLAHYRKLRIDPLTKTIVFSDELTTEKAVEIKKYAEGKIGASFGIGTHLTNDVGVEPLNMVIKLSASRGAADAGWNNVVKLSDDRGKHTGNPSEIDLCVRTLERRVE